ncbi:MAG: DUF3800 domain-containing protein [Phycisphaerae bacterium]
MSNEISEKEYVLFCDESVRDGKFFSNFYGGVLVPASSLESSALRLNAVKQQSNLHGEVKWIKVTENYLDKYIQLLNAFFAELKAGNAKIRIMFRQNARVPRNLSKMQQEQGFYILYYQFIKHAFGFSHMPPHAGPVHLRIYFDQFPDTGEKIAQFRGYILGLNQSVSFRNNQLAIRDQDFTEIRSHDHVHLQCLDIVLGAMAFRLNDLHLQKPVGQTRRGSRTIAKEKLYKHILTKIRELRPNFNAGISTGGDFSDRWHHPYRHWAFVPTDSEFDTDLTKKQK